MSDVRVYKTEEGGKRELTQLISSISWSGDYKSAARELSCKLVSAIAGDLPKVEVNVGDPVTLDVDGVTRFAGNIVSITRISDAGELEFRAFDRGRILKCNDAIYQFFSETPEGAVARIAADFGIELGEVAKTNVKITRNFVAIDLYSIIMTMYSLASDETGDKYIVRFDALKLCVLKKQKPADPVRIAAKINLQDLTVTESIEKLVNSVQIYNDSYSVTGTKEDAESIRKYGLFRSQIKEDDKADKKASSELDENSKPTHKITVSNRGDIRALTGTVVEMREEHTGLLGEFYVDSDTHTWTRGQYYNKLVLNFKNIMDEKSSGKEKDK